MAPPPALMKDGSSSSSDSKSAKGFRKYVAKKRPFPAKPAGAPTIVSAASQGKPAPPRPGAGTKHKLSGDNSTAAVTDDGTLVERLQKVKGIIEAGSETPDVFHKSIAADIGTWLALAKELTTDAARGKRQRIAGSTDYTKAAEDFTMAQMKKTLRGTTNDKAMTDVKTGGIIRWHGDEWMMLVWKGAGIFAPQRVAFFMKEFLFKAILGSDLEVAWTMSSVREFFRMDELLSMYRVTDEHYRHRTFIPAEKQDAVLALVDKKLKRQQPDAVSVHNILARVGSVVELIGNDMHWEMAFTRSADQLRQRRLKLQEDDAALESIIGPKVTWGIAPKSYLYFDPDDKNYDGELLDL